MTFEQAMRAAYISAWYRCACTQPVDNGALHLPSHAINADRSFLQVPSVPHPDTRQLLRPTSCAVGIIPPVSYLLSVKDFAPLLTLASQHGCDLCYGTHIFSFFSFCTLRVGGSSDEAPITLASCVSVL